jgi:lysophospholipase L1-like esterase
MLRIVQPDHLFALLLMLVMSGFAHAQSPAPSPERWVEEIDQITAQDATRPPPPNAVLFVGSSSIRLWTTLRADFPSVPVIQRGFGGSEIADVLQYADRIILPYRPRRVVLYAGDNDLANGKTPAQVLADFQALVARIHAALPEARIAFIAIKPSVARWHLIDAIREANTRIYAFTDTDARLAYLDIFTPMLGADGRPRPELLAEDGLHLNAQGYALWTTVVQPFLE